ncbi:mandelate racemase/muconate lactonizing enzyme family protein [Opitutaceae bacterium TAV4]|nr:mandelate racemase/muconate lactonizing enzyme family protein [Opitutaceae bacterium TAV4]RRK02147.1 mandelate racemase/muconate lactonizing enzyme family protein [Opitutaceae bacterium TAV3]
MKITAIKVRRLAISAKPWFGGSVPKGCHQTFEFPLLEIVTDADIKGYSTGYCPLGQGAGCARLLADVYTNVLLGQNPLETEALWQKLRRLHRHLYNMSDALLGMVDVALWDIKGKAYGQSIASMLGIQRRSLPSYGTGFYFNKTPDMIAADALALKAQGYHGVKFNFSDGPAQDIPRLCAAREAVGPDFKLMLDGSSFYSYQDALTVGRELDRLNYYWLEEPLFDRQLGRLKALSRELKTPILAAETVSLLELSEYVRDDGVDLVRGDVYLKAGITGLWKAVNMCELLNVPLEIHVCVSPLLDVANLHVACASSTCAWMESHQPMFRFGLKNNPMNIDSKGLLHLPDGPGLGVELDWDWIDQHTLEQIKGKRI